MSVLTSHDPVAANAAALYRILQSVAAHELPPADECLEVPLRGLGLDSAGFVRFLVAVEDQLSFVWTDEVPREVLSTLRTLADFVTREQGRTS